jgi:hypothetical protein
MRFLWKINIESEQEPSTIYDDDGDDDDINDL